MVVGRYRSTYDGRGALLRAYRCGTHRSECKSSDRGPKYDRALRSTLACEATTGRTPARLRGLSERYRMTYTDLSREQDTAQPRPATWPQPARHLGVERQRCGQLALPVPPRTRCGMMRPAIALLL